MATGIQPLDSTAAAAKKALANKDHVEPGRPIARELDRRKATTADLAAPGKRIGCSLRSARAGTGGAVKTVVFTLNKGQRAVLDAALVRFGVGHSGRSVLGKEQALMAILSRVA